MSIEANPSELCAALRLIDELRHPRSLDHLPGPHLLHALGDCVRARRVGGGVLTYLSVAHSSLTAASLERDGEKKRSSLTSADDALKAARALLVRTLRDEADSVRGWDGGNQQ